MRKTLAIAVSALALSISSVMAADLPQRSPPPAPVEAPPVFTWTGFYVGLNAGYAWGKKTTIQGNGLNATNDLLGVIFTGNLILGQPLQTQTIDPKSIAGFGGLQIGYNRQMSAKWVAGVEADIQVPFQNSRYVLNTIVLGAPESLTASNQLKWFGTVRARVGYLMRPNVLLFATGGLAFGQNNASGSVLSSGLFGGGLNCIANTVCIAGQQNKTSVGWTLGAGLEWKVKQNWSLKAEYLHVDLGKTTYNMVHVAPSAGPGFWRVRNNNAFDLVRIGLNYHFGSRASAVVAKY